MCEDYIERKERLKYHKEYNRKNARKYIFRQGIPLEEYMNTPQCSYGCGNIATIQLSNGMWCCNESQSKCQKLIKNWSGSKKGIGRIYKNTFLNEMYTPQCAYGCGNIAFYHINRKGKSVWCCSDNACRCPKDIERMKKISTGRKHTEEEKKKIASREYKTGSENPTYGRKHSIETIEKLKVKAKLRTSNPMLGKRHKKETIEKIKNKRIELGLSVLTEDLSEFKKYRRRVIGLTKHTRKIKFSPHELNSVGLAGIIGKNQVDHIFSILDGFLNKVHEELIAHPNNLRLIPWEENLKKHSKSLITLEELYLYVKKDKTDD